MKLRNYILAFLVLGLAMNSCKKDDNDDTVLVESRDRTEQYLVDLDSIEEYLSTHFYNYEEFQANPDTMDFEIIFDTISVENGTQDKIPLIDQVESKIVSDNISDVEYKLYFLKVREGGGEQPKFTDSTFVTYKGAYLNDEIFDNSPNPIWFELLSVVGGFREGLLEFKEATTNTLNPDGTTTFTDYGIGAVFMPSGLAYFDNPPSGISFYSPLVFRFNLVGVNQTDHDGDHVPSYLEDLNGDGVFTLEEDDTDDDLFVNYFDADDDGDGTLTKDEDLEPDPDPNVDSNGDGIPDNDIGDGDPTNDDTDGDGIPNYLDPDDTESRNPDDN